MFVFKLSWLPYILILAGILLAAEGQPAALILTVAGGVWLYFKYKNKHSENNANTSASDSSSPVNTSHATSTTSNTVPPAAQVTDTGKFCTRCGTKAKADAVFCSNCGEKL